MKKFSLILLLFAMVLITGCSSNTDDGEKDVVKDPSTPLTDDKKETSEIPETSDLPGIVVGELFNGSIAAGASQVYTLTITKDGYYSFKSIGTLDLEASISTMEAAFVAFGDGNSNTDDNFEIRTHLEKGTYRIGLDSTDSVAGDFQLLVEEVTLTHVTSIEKNTSINDTLIQGETNSIEFTVSENGDVQLYLISSVDSYGAIYDSNGDIVVDNDNNMASIDFYIETTLTSGVYTLEISATGDFGSADYELFYDKPDTRVYTVITVDSIFTDTAESKEVLYFELLVTESVVVNIYTVGDDDFEAEIYTSNSFNMPFAYNDDGGEDYNFKLSNLTLEPGLYYLVVFNLDYHVSDVELHIDSVVE